MVPQIRLCFCCNNAATARLTLSAKDNRQLGLPVARLPPVAVLAARGDLERAEALPGVRLRPGDPDPARAFVCVGAPITLPQIAGHLIGADAILGQPAAPLRVELLAPAQAAAKASMPALDLRHVLRRALVLGVAALPDADRVAVSEASEPKCACLEGRFSAIVLTDILLHHRSQDDPRHLQALGPLLSVLGVRLRLGGSEFAGSAGLQ